MNCEYCDGTVEYEPDNNGPIVACPVCAGRQIDWLQRQCEGLRAERDHARARVDTAVKLLTGIHSLLYPAPIKTADGRTMVFRPKSPNPHEVLQELSDRIRALPDELLARGMVTTGYCETEKKRVGYR